jgi:hypothetical protein
MGFFSGDVQPWNTPHLMNKSVESNEEKDERDIDSKNNPLTQKEIEFVKQQ